MKKLLDENAARLDPREAERMWQAVRPGRVHRAASGWSVPRLALAALVLVVICATGVWFFGGTIGPRAGRPRQSAPNLSAERLVPEVPPPNSAAETAAPSQPAPASSDSVAAVHPSLVPDVVPAPARPQPRPGPVERSRAQPARSAESSGPQGLAAAVPDSAGWGLIRGVVTDSAGQPEPYATLILQDTALGTQSNSEGRYTIRNVPPGPYTLKAIKMGFDAETRPVDVASNREIDADFELHESTVTSMFEVVVNGATPRINKSDSAVRQSVSKDDLASLPVDQLNAAIGLKGGIVQQNGELHDRGGRSGEVQYQIDGVPMSDPLSGNSVEVQLPVTYSHLKGVYRAQNHDDAASFDAMFFQHYGVNPFVDAGHDPLATFAVDVDNASYSLTRAYLDRNELPPPEAVRVEEFQNVLDHHYAPPRSRGDRDGRSGAALAIHVTSAPSPFGAGLVLARVGLKAREVAVVDRKPAVLTFVIDVSGSMAQNERLETVKAALRELLGQLKADDRVGIVAFSNDSRVVVPLLTMQDRDRIESAIAELQPLQSTNAEAGLVDGYAMAAGGFHDGWINRVIFCSDGVANVGVTGAEGIQGEIARQARRGIELTAIGVGMGNYNDVLLEKLADQGDGNYYYVDDLPEARRVFEEHLTGTLQTVARQAKIQVEFNPDLVERYRLIGYENRNVADRDFRNDAVDAGEVGAGHEVTALFELALRDDNGSGRHSRGDLATVRVRYEDPDSKQVRELTEPLRAGDVAGRLRSTEPMFRMDAAVAEFAEILRDSYWARGSRLTEVADLARDASHDLDDPAPLREMVSLMERSAALWSTRQLDASRFDEVHPRWEPGQRGR